MNDAVENPAASDPPARHWGPYPIYCQTPGCVKSAQYKIAAQWSYGQTSELKTYALSCADCLPRWYAHALARQKECCCVEGETLEAPCIYELCRGTRDGELPRRRELERQLRPIG